MRICVLTSSYPRWRGDPSSSFVADLVEHLQKRPGNEVTVLAPGAVGALPRERWDGAEVRRLTYFRPRRCQKLAYGEGVPWNLRRSFLAWLNVPAFLATFAWHLLVQARRADVVHAHWGVLGALAVFLRPIHKLPVAVTIHGSDLTTNIGLIRRVSRFAIRRADAVLTPSSDFRESCSAIRGEDGRCHFVAHGVCCPPEDELARLRKQRAGGAADCRIATVGRLIPQRRHDLLVRAFARVLGEFPQASLCIVGGGAQRPELETLARDLGIAERVTMAGRVPPKDVFEYLLSSDLYVSPTTVDNFGTAVVEAAAYALPVVTTSVGFPAELVVDGQTGYVVPPANEDALTDALARVLRMNPASRADMGWRMRERVVRMGLTWDISVEKMSCIFEQCITESSR
jgi:glycosyltransferase involved in cell wall biosynthesis